MHLVEMKLEITITPEQEDKVVAKSIKTAYRINKSIYDPHAVPGDEESLRKALKVVYHFYTGKVLK